MFCGPLLTIIFIGLVLCLKILGTSVLEGTDLYVGPPQERSSEQSLTAFEYLKYKLGSVCKQWETFHFLIRYQSELAPFPSISLKRQQSRLQPKFKVCHRLTLRLAWQDTEMGSVWPFTLCSITLLKGDGRCSSSWTVLLPALPGRVGDVG